MAKHKYISQEAAIDAVDVCNLHRGIIDALQAIISDIPSADVVEVVRCKDCAKYDPDAEWCNVWQYYLQPDFFCACGKRRADNGN